MAELKGPYQHPGLELREIEGKGLGVFTTVPLKKGETLVVSAGRKVEMEDLNDPDDLCFQIDEHTYYCPLEYENPDMSWRINHSCDPNSGDGGDKLVATRDIQAGEEIVYDYALTETNPDYSFVCRCGSANCRKTFTGNDWKLPEVQKRNKGYFESYVQAKIDALKK